MDDNCMLVWHNLQGHGLYFQVELCSSTVLLLLEKSDFLFSFDSLFFLFSF